MAASQGSHVFGRLVCRPRSLTAALPAARRDVWCRSLHLSCRRSPSVCVYFPGDSEVLGKVKAFPQKPGADVQVGDIVAEVETGPSRVLDVATPHAGEVVAHMRKPGEVVRGGDALVELHVSLADMAAGWWRAVTAGGRREEAAVSASWGVAAAHADGGGLPEQG
eukprot:CAMPEP_0176275810 /NCGR_PEP_ID=MMETSP0121_2-20121125/47432_1 /TAXON_ID=160619 /ORGANISM="Kryptoperidinium foliaceum, Strain CCMP 1326" /LENGTH=164 /DNA_ID=CAMNT_0017616047 /DNA_START=27 /DNA_END=517 /DNA_ORIENTATION=+